MSNTDLTFPSETRPPRLCRLLGGDWLGNLSIVVLVILAIVAVFAPLLAPQDANDQSLTNRLAPPVFWAGEGSFDYPLGTDGLGRDILSRLIVGARLTLTVGLSAAAIATVIGVTLGILAGTKGGWIDAVIMRTADIQMGFPTVLMILLVILVFGSSPTTLIFAIGLNVWMFFTRLFRNETCRIVNEPYVAAARVTGMPGLALTARHVLPQLRGMIATVYLMEVPKAILSAAALSFLGIGITPPHVSWGLMIGDSQTFVSIAAWPAVFPGIAIAITVMALYMFASWAEPRLDPLRRRSKAS